MWFVAGILTVVAAFVFGFMSITGMLKADDVKMILGIIITAASAAQGMRLGLWLGPDGFGETPESMAARRGQLLSWVKDFNVGLFKMDTVVSALEHKDRHILEKKYQSLADALSEARRIDPKFVAINHRINNSPYMLTITDCLLWRGQETYIDVHISNRTASLYNRDCSIGRELTSSFYGTPLDRSGWRATNFLGETTPPRRVLKAIHVPAEDAPGREYAVAVTAGPAKFDPVDGVYVVALVDGRTVVPRHRAPSYPYHNYEWNSGAPKLAGMTFRLPIDPAWKGKTVEFRVLMSGDGADGAEAVLRLVTPKPVFAEVTLRVDPEKEGH